MAVKMEGESMGIGKGTRSLKVSLWQSCVLGRPMHDLAWPTMIIEK